MKSNILLTKEITLHMSFLKIGLWDGMIVDPATMQSMPKLPKSMEGRIILYGGMPASKVNGGRENDFEINGDKVINLVTGEEVGSLESLTTQLIQNIEAVNKGTFAFDLTMNNHFVSEEDLRDDRLLRVLDFMAEQNLRLGMGNGVTYTNDTVRNFINTRYGKILFLTASILRFYMCPQETYEEHLNRGERVVFTHLDVIEQGKFDAVPKSLRGNTFFLVQSVCKHECSAKHANNHYIKTSQANMGGPKNQECDIEGTSVDIHLRVPYLVAQGFSPKYGRLGPSGFNAFYYGEKWIDAPNFINIVLGVKANPCPY